MNDWISVKERTPERGGQYLTWCRYRDGDTAMKIKLWKDGAFTSEAKAVTHWMPLPEPPEDPDDHPDR